MIEKKTITISLDTPTPEEIINDNKNQENKEQKKADKYYLPVLNINSPPAWPSAPLEQRRHFTDAVAYETCLGNCCGYKGLKAACCYLDTDDIEHVLGPLDEPWIKMACVKLSKEHNITYRREDIVIDFEEGKIIGEKFFNGHPVFQAETSYPMLRFQVIGNRFACKFLNPTSQKCTIYTIRSKMCRNYLCQYIKANFLIRTPSNPNTYKKLR